VAKRGRKSKYFSHVEPRLEEIGWWCRDGLIEEEICKRLGVGVRNFNDYKRLYPQLKQVLREGKEFTDYRVEDALLNRATGIEWQETTEELVLVERTVKGVKQKIALGTELIVTKRITKYIPPDPVAAIFWLKNRRRGTWSNSDNPLGNTDTGKLDQLTTALQKSFDKVDKKRGGDDMG